MKIQESTILITGATGGIGRHLADKLSASGASLVLVGRNPTTLTSLAETLSGEHRVIEADINDRHDRQHVTDVLQSQAITIDGVVQLAGLSQFACLNDADEDQLERLIHTNLISPIQFTRQLLPCLNDTQSTLLFVGSTLGAIGFPGYTGYCASKFGLRGFVEALERECANTSVQVKYVAPRATNTAMNSERAIRMNAALGNTMDDSADVAECLYQSLIGHRSHINIGWPERFFIPLNAIFTRAVSWAIAQKTPLIKHYATEQSR